MDRSEVKSLKIWQKFAIGTLITGYIAFALNEYVPIHIKHPNLVEDVITFFALATPILVLLVATMDYMINRSKRYLVVNIVGGTILFILSAYVSLIVIVDTALKYPDRRVLYKHKSKNQEILSVRYWYDGPFEVIKAHDYKWFTYEVPLDTLSIDKTNWIAIRKTH
ncbi:hypothetical protein [Roseivirga sp. E12]|uniref:hypothetical protein n=1 Tax=Roseivirga sp. E12 TaxID=2819237 RepID=UPI001ABCBB94|nr:hypothetical protein [Roseivirga sp. E12]MBO3698704.1 hypothetical protein [Roseivirga sp. E12]